MKNDETHPDLQTHIEPELEARLVASVLGEASAFEAAELERLVSEKPELAIFKRRIEAVHGLIGPAVRLDQAPLRLAPERRAKILEAIGATPARVPSAEPNTPVLVPLETAMRKRPKKWMWASSLAASITFATVLSLQFTAPSHRPARPEPSQTILGPMPATEMVAVELPALVSAPPFRQGTTRELPSIQVQDDALQQRATTLRQGVVAGGRGGRGGGAGGAGGARLAQASEAETAAKTWGLPAAANEAARKRIPAAPITAGIVVGDELSAAGGKNKEEADKKDLAFGPPALTEKGAVNGFGKDAVALSPFQVSADKDVGYFAGNTLAGSRVNTFLSDGYSSPAATRDIPANNVRPNAASFGGLGQAVASAPPADGFLTELKIVTGMVISDASRLERKPSAVAIDQLLSKQKAAAAPAPKSQPSEPARGETNAAKEPVSTFSLHVSDVSFRLAQTALARGETPDPSRIRPEEFYNAFNYGDPAPTANDKISARIEQAAHPLLQQRNLVRIAMKVASSGRGAGQPLHLTILLDTSGSMEREDRIASVRRALGVLASLLGKNDRVTLIGFARTTRLLAEHLPGDQAGKLGELAGSTPFTGGTNLEEALKLSGELARRHRDPAAQNRIVLITDGAANLGNADPAQLAAMVEALRQQNIALDACGVGTDGLDDAVLEALTRKGDGRYYVINQPEDADAGFARQLAGAFRPAAENVKVQVRFNPARVGSYRLIGFEQHRLREEDFRNDQVDAAELAADEAAVALYQVEVLPQGEGELGDVFVRFRDAGTGNMVERSWTMLHEPKARAFDRATPSIQLAGTAALLAEKLRGGDAGNLINLDELVPTVNRLRGLYPKDARVQELITMFEQMRRRAGR